MAGVLLGPTVLDGRRVEEDATGGRVEAARARIVCFGTAKENGPTRAEEDHDVRALGEAVDGGVAHDLARHLARDPLPREFGADLDVAQAQVAQGHDDDKPLGVAIQQAAPQLTGGDGAGHLEQDPRRGSVGRRRRVLC